MVRLVARKTKKTIAPLAVLCFLLSCKTDVSQNDPSLVVQPGLETSFVSTSGPFVGNVALKNPKYHAYENGTWGSESFSRTILDSPLSITHKHSKTRAPDIRDFIEARATLPDGSQETFFAYVGDKRSINIGYASSFTYLFFSSLLNRAPLNLEELNTVSNIINNSINTSCFVDSGATLLNQSQAYRVSLNAILGNSAFQELVSNYGISSFNLNQKFGLNRAPRASSLNPSATPNGGVKGIFVQASKTQEFKSTISDLDGDPIFARWYNSETGEKIDGPLVSYEQVSGLPPSLKLPKILSISSDINDANFNTGSNKEHFVELRLCDGGKPVIYKYHLTVNPLNRRPIITTAPVSSFPAQVYDSNDATNTTTVFQVDAMDPDGDPLFLENPGTSNSGIILSASENLSNVNMLLGRWIKSAGSDTGNKAQEGWTSLQMENNNVPPFLDFSLLDNGDDTNSLRIKTEEFPLPESDPLDLEFEIIQETKYGDFRLRFKNVPRIYSPVPVHNKDLYCAVELLAGGKQLSLYCSSQNQFPTDLLYDFKAAYQCPGSVEEGIQMPGPCQKQALPLISGSGNPGDSANIYRAYIHVRPSQKQSSEQILIGATLVVSDDRASQSTATFGSTFLGVLSTQEKALDPIFTHVTQTIDSHPTIVPDDTRMPISPYSQFFPLHKPEERADSRAINNWEKTYLPGTPKYGYKFSEGNQSWVEGLEWRKLSAGSSETDSILSKHDGLFINSTAFNQDWGHIRFLKDDPTATPRVSESLRRFRYLEKEDNDYTLWVFIPNYFETLEEDEIAFYNDDAICKMTSIFERDTNDFNNLPVNSAEYANNPIHNDIKMACVVADASCENEANLENSLCKTNTLADANKSWLSDKNDFESRATHIDISVERLIFAANTNELHKSWHQYRWDSTGHSFVNNSFENQHAKINQSAQPGNTVPSYFRNTFNYLLNLGANWTTAVNFLAPLDDPNTEEKALRVRRHYTHNTSWQPTHNTQMASVYLNHHKRTIRWPKEYAFRPGNNGQALLSRYIPTLSTSPQLSACQYLIRDQARSVKFFCEHRSTSSFNDAPAPYSHIQTITPDRLVEAGTHYWDAGLNALFVAIDDAPSGQASRFLSHGTILMPLAGGQGTINNNAALYYRPADNRIYKNPAAGRFYVGRHSRWRTYNNAGTIPVSFWSNAVDTSVAFEIRLRNSGSSRHDYSETVVESIKQGPIFSYLTKDLDGQELESNLDGPIAARTLSADQQNQIRAAAYQPTLVRGKVKAGDISSSQIDKEDLIYNVVSNKPLFAYVAQGQPFGEAPVVNKFETCTNDWGEENLVTVDSLKYYGVDTLEPDEFALIFFPYIDCGNTVVDFSGLQITLSVGSADKPNNSTLTLNPAVRVVPMPPKFSWGGGSGGYTTNNASSFNNNGCTNMPRREPENYYSSADTPWNEFEPLFPTAVSVPADENKAWLGSSYSDFDTNKRLYVHSGIRELFGRVRTTRPAEGNTPASGGMQASSNTCWFYVYHPNFIEFDVAFLEKEDELGQTRFFDPTVGSANPGKDFDKEIFLGLQEEDLESLRFKTSATSNVKSIKNHFPSPQIYPNFFTPRTNTEGLVSPEAAGATIADLADHKHLYFRNPYVVPELNKAYLVFSKVENLKEQEIVCPQDLDHYTAITDANRHLKFLENETPPAAANSLCFEIYPNNVSKWKLPNLNPPEGEEPDSWFLSFEVNSLSNAIAPGTNVDMECEVYEQFSPIHAGPLYSYTCKSSDSAYNLSFNESESTIQATFLSAGLSTFGIKTQESWGGMHINLLWGDRDVRPEGMYPEETPAKLNSVVAIDDGFFRTVLPIRISAIAEPQLPNIYSRWEEETLRTSPEPRLTEDTPLNVQNALSVISESPTVTPIAFFRKGRTLNPMMMSERGITRDFTSEFDDANTYADRRPLDLVTQVLSPQEIFKNRILNPEDFDGPQIDLISRNISSSSRVSNYSFKHAPPSLAGANKNNYAWALQPAVETWAQFPMTFYSGSASELVLPMLWDHDEDPKTALEVFLDFSVTFMGAQNGAAPFKRIGRYNDPITQISFSHHELNLAPCLVNHDFFRTVTRGDPCPALANRGAGDDSDDGVYPGTYIGSVVLPGGSTIPKLDFNKNHFFAPGTSCENVSSATGTPLLKGENLTHRFAFYDPNYREGITLRTPVIVQSPTTSGLFSSQSQPFILPLNPSHPGSCPIGESPNKAVWVLNWRLQDIHVAKTEALDAITRNQFNTPTPSLMISVEDNGEFPESLSESFQVNYHAWDRNEAPSYLGVVYSNQVSYSDEQVVFDLNRTRNHNEEVELVFAARDNDRGDALILRAINLGALGIPEASSQLFGKTDIVADGKTCSQLIAAKAINVHSQQVAVCLKVTFRPISPLTLNYQIMLEVEDIPWHYREQPAGTKFYNPTTRSYSLDSGEEYRNAHPESSLLESRKSLVSYFAIADGEGFLLPYQTMPIAYRNEIYQQDFSFISPSNQNVTCELLNVPKVPDLIVEQYFDPGEYLFPEETMTVERIHTPEPTITICRLRWHPQNRFWPNIPGGMNVSVRFKEAGVTRATVNYKINPYLEQDPFDDSVPTQSSDGVRQTSMDGPFFEQFRPQISSVSISASGAGVSYDSARSAWTGPEVTEWTFSYNKSDLEHPEKAFAYPLIESWYMDGVLLQVGGENFKFIVPSRYSGQRTLSLVLRDGGAVVSSTSSAVYIKNSTLASNPSFDLGSVVPSPDFNPLIDKFNFMGMLSDMHKNVVVFHADYRGSQHQIHSLKFPDLDTSAPTKFRYVHDLLQPRMAWTSVSSVPTIGFTGSGGPSRPNGTYAKPAYHFPKLLSVAPNGELNTAYVEQYTEDSIFWRSTLNQDVGLSRVIQHSPGWRGPFSTILTHHTLSTERSTQTLWFHADNLAVIGHLAYGTDAPQPILDYRLFHFSNHSWAAVLTSKGLHFQKMSSGNPGYTTWNSGAAPNHNYIPEELSTADQFFDLDLLDGENIIGGAIASDHGKDQLSASNNPKIFIVWTRNSSTQKNRVHVFRINQNETIEVVSSTDQISASPARLSGTDAVNSNFAYYSDEAKLLHIAEPGNSLINSVDISDLTAPIIRESAIPSGIIEGFHCTKDGLTCYAYDSTRQAVWRLK